MRRLLKQIEQQLTLYWKWKDCENPSKM
jgi:hypothetical protein